MNKPPFFFSASQSVDIQLGQIISFIWASYAGLRELWWQVRGFKSNFPDLHISEIENKFFGGLPIPGGIDLNKLCIQTDWTTHEEEFLKWLLFETCTLYEGWAEKVCSEVFTTARADKCAKQIQFPVTPRSNGYQYVINLANQNTSKFIKSTFFPSLSGGKFNKWTQIQNLLIGYRYFKECRNTFIHSDGLVTQDLIKAQSDFIHIQSTGKLILKHTFVLPISTLDSRIKLNLPDVILFTRLVKYLISTFDAALCVSVSCESILKERLRSLIVKDVKWQSLPHDLTKRERRIDRMLSAAKIPNPTSIKQVDAWMVSNGLI
jgi:hypothetical protein